MKRKIWAALAAMMLLVLLAPGCTKTEPNETKTTEPGKTQAAENAPTDTAQTEETDPPIELKGTAVTEAKVTNEAGNYFIPVPDSWVGKTSYELDGTSTFIYHITRSPEEPELNPVLVNFGVVSEGEVAVGEVFMEISGVKYYSVPRLDFPYNEGTKDAEEFAALYEEVPLVLQNVWLIDDSAWQEQIQVGPFTKNDAYFSDIRIGDAKDDVLAKAGQPQSTSEIVLEATDETRDINEFSFGQLVFVNEKLVVAQIRDDTYTGPRGIKVGMTIDEVAAKFVAEKEIETEFMSIYYRANPGEDTLYTVPPCAVLYKGDMQTLAFSVFSEESDAEGLTVEQLKDEYTYMHMEQYQLTCEFDAQGIMYSFAVRLGTPSE